MQKFQVILSRTSVFPHRWKKDSSGQHVSHAISKRPVLQFVSIKRKDCGEWAIPGVSMCCLVKNTLKHY